MKNVLARMRAAGHRGDIRRKHSIARVEQVCEQTERQQNLPGNDTPIAGM